MLPKDSNIITTCEREHGLTKYKKKKKRTKVMKNLNPVYILQKLGYFTWKFHGSSGNRPTL